MSYLCFTVPCSLNWPSTGVFSWALLSWLSIVLPNGRPVLQHSCWCSGLYRPYPPIWPPYNCMLPLIKAKSYLSLLLSTHTTIGTPLLLPPMLFCLPLLPCFRLAVSLLSAGPTLRSYCCILSAHTWSLLCILISLFFLIWLPVLSSRNTYSMFALLCSQTYLLHQVRSLPLLDNMVSCFLSIFA